MKVDAYVMRQAIVRAKMLETLAEMAGAKDLEALSVAELLDWAAQQLSLHAIDHGGAFVDAPPPTPAAGDRVRRGRGMSVLLAIAIPGKPQGARRHRTGQRGGHTAMYRDPEQIAAEDHIVWLTRWEGPPLDEPVRLVIETRHRRPKSMCTRRYRSDGERPFAGKPDADNVAKLVMDALTRAGVWVDDTVVAQLEVRRWWVGVDREGVQAAERTTVRVEGL